MAFKKISEHSVRTDKGTHCPVCNTYLDAAANSDGSGSIPSPGDLSICIECLSYLRYQEDLSLKLLTDDELIALSSEELYSITQARNYFQRVKANKK